MTSRATKKRPSRKRKPKKPEPYRMPVLMTYAYFGNEAVAEKWLTDPRVEVMVDSGAFSALNTGRVIELDEYIAFLKRWGKHIAGYIALDVLQDPEATDRNLQTMLEAGLRPIPVHVLGDGEERMDELFGLSNWVAFGGLRRPHRGLAPQRYVKAKMEWAKGRDVHWLGYTSQPMLLAFNPYSCDCSNMVSAATWGRMDVYLGRGKWVGIQRGEWKDAPEHVREAVRGYGVEPNALNDPGRWRLRMKERGYESHLALLVSVRSWATYTMEFRRTHGTRIFQALSAGDINFWCYQQAVEWVDSLGLLAPKRGTDATPAHRIRQHAV